MENKDRNGTLSYGTIGDDTISASSDNAVHAPPPGALAGISLDDPYAPEPLTSQEQPRSRASVFLRFARRLDVILVALLLIGGVVAFVLGTRNPDPENSLSNTPADRFGTVALPLEDFISGKNLTLSGTSNVTINGSMQLNNGLSLAPSVQPTGAKAGQLYYDQGTNQLAYFNGQQFVFLTDGQQGVQSLGGATGQLILGGGLGLTGQQLTNTGVLTVQGQSGNVNFTAGSGIILNGTTLSNGGVISIVPGSSNVAVSNDGNGNVTIDMVGAGTGTVTSGGGTAGTVPLFTASQNIEDSIITQSGLTVTISGDLSVVTGGLSLSNALTVSNGGTGANSLAGNGVLVGNGTSPISSVAAGAPGLCLLSTAGAPAWAACPSASGVNSLNGLTGALSIANASAAGSTITIDDASTSTKGIASFNGTNFSVSGGAVNTIQNINSGATPTFAGVNTNTITPSAALTVGISAQTALLQGSTTTITSNGVGNNIVLNSAATIELQDNTNVTGSLAATGDVAVNGGDLTSSGALNITPGGTLTVGVATQTLTLQGGAATSFRATSGGNTTIVGFTSPTANTTLNFPALAAGTYTICTTSGNCSGAATSLQSAYDNSTSPEIVLDATRGALSIRDNATPLGANLLEVQSNDGSATYLAVTATGIAVTGTATVSGNVNAAGALQTGGTTRIDSSGNATNIGTLTLTGAISGGTTYTGSGNINTTSGAIQTNGTSRIDNSGNLVNIAAVTASGSATFQGGTVTVGTNAQAGSLVLNDGSSNTGTLQVAALGQNTAYILPDPGVGSATICLSTGNCAGSGGGVTTSGGTTNRVTKFTGSQTIGDSIITDNGTTVSVAGAFSVTGNGTLQGGTLTLGTSGQAGLIVLNDGSSNTGSLQVAALGQDTAYTLPDPGAGTATICLSTGNCAGAGGGVTTAGGTTSRLPVFTGTQSIGNSWLLQNSSTLELDNTRNLSLLGGNLSVTGSGTFSGDVAVNGGDLTSSGALNITPGGTLTIGATGQQLVLQGSASTTLTATNGANTTSVTFQNPGAAVTYRFATASAGSYDICTTAGNCVGTGGGVSTSGGTVNRLAKFSGSQVIDNSTITDDGTNVTTTVDMVIQGGEVTLGSASQTGTIVLHDGDGDTTTLQAGNSSGDLTFILPINSGTANQCLKQSGTGNQLIWQDCDGGSGGSSATLQTAYNNSTDPEISLNSSVGGVSIRDNATPISGNLFEIQNSTGGTTYFGVNTTGASVTGAFAATGNINTSGGAIQTAGTTRIDNSGNLVNIGTVSAGTYNGQTISSSASFTGTLAVAGNTTLTGDLGVNGGDLTSSGALNITPGGTLTIGATGQQLVLQGSASTTLAVTGGGFTTTIGFNGVPVGNVVYNFDRTPAAGTYDICTSAGNCLDVFDNVTGSGTIGTIPVFTGSTTALGDSLLSQSGGTVTVNGHLNLISGNQFRINGTQISSANLSNDSNLAKLSASQTFTGNTISFQNAADSANAFNVQNQAGARVLTVDTDDAEIELGVGSSLDGKLVFSNVSNNNTVTILPGTPTSSRTITLPDADGIICLSSGNCAGAGATLQTAYNFSVGGTTPKIKVNSTKGGVDIQDADTTISGSLFTVRASNSLGLGSAMLDVHSAGAVTLQNAANSDDAFRVLTQGGTSVFTVNTDDGLIELGQSNTLSGQIVFSDSSSAFTGSLVQGALTNNRTYTLPDTGGTICLNSGNCASSGGGVTTSGGTTDRLPVFNGAQTLTNSWLLQNSSTLELDNTRNLSLMGGDLSVTGNVTATGTYNTNTFTSSGLQFGAASTAIIQSAASQALTITSNAAATWSTSNGNLVITAQGNLNLGVGGGQNINIGTNNAAHTITVGNQSSTGAQSITIGSSANAASAVSIESGSSGTINIGNGATGHSINIGAGAAAQTVTVGSTNSTSSTTIQGGSGNIVLTTSTGNRVQIGSATTDATTVLLTVDSYDGTAGTPAGTNGAMYYDTSTNAFRCYQGGSWIDCITASGGFVSLQNAYTNSTGGTTSEIIVDATRGALDIQDRSTSNGGTIGANLLNVRATAANDATAGTLLFSVSNAGNLTAAGTYNTNTFTSSTLQFGAGSSATVQAANNAGANATAYTLNLFGGNATGTTCGTNCIGGDVVLQGGGSTGSGNRTGGSVFIDAGVGDDTNGSINIGTAASGDIFIGRPASGSDVTIQAGDVVYLTADGSATSRIQIGDGGPTGSATPDYLALDVKSNASGSTDPSGGAEGYMYYSDNLNKFRCYQNTGWTDCISTLQGAYTQSTGGTTSEVIVDATRGALDIQDRSTSNGGTIGANLLNVRATAANDSTAGSLLFGVGNTGAVTSQNSTDSANAFRILNSTSGELFGVDSSSSILRLLNNNAGRLGGFQTAGNDILDIGAGNIREGGNSVTVDGYVYYLGGCNSGSAQTTAYYARLNNDGSTGTWATTTALPQATCNNAVTTYNGYIYVNGGASTNALSRDVYYAKPNSDGTITSWSTVTGAIPTSGQGKISHAAVAYNGYLYLIGGSLVGGAPSDKVFFGRINADGSVATMAEAGTNWMNGNGGGGTMATVANGYLYAKASTNVTYAKITSSGTIGTTGTTDSDNLSSDRSYGPLLAMNGYLYSLGGGGGTAVTTVSYSQLNSDGSIGAWTNDTNSPLPSARGNCGGVVKNGYVYCIAGYSGSADTGTVFYATGTRVTIGGSLDLIANSGENVAEGGTGGELTAGNTNIVGTLNVSGNANFKDSAIVNNNFAVTGLTTLTSTANSTTAFRMLNASGTPMFTIDTTNSYVYIGNPTSDTTGALLVLDTKSSSGDPTGLNGAMYYNSSLGIMRCYQYDEWTDCGIQSARTSFHAYTDLMGTNDSGTVADMHFTLYETVLGGESFNDTAGVAGHPGIVEQDVDVDNSQTAIQSIGLDNQIILGNTNTWRYETSLRIPTLSDGTNTFLVRSGFLDSEAYSETDTNGGANNAAGCYFKYSHGVNGGRWQGTCVNNSATVQTCDLYSGSPSTTVAANTWYRLTVSVNSAGNSVDFRVNGSTTNGNGRCQITSQIPTGGVGYANFLMKTNGAGTVSLQSDYIDVLGQFGTPR